jgi:hypothetical protein
MTTAFNNILNLPDGMNSSENELLNYKTDEESQERLNELDSILTQHMGNNYKFYLFLIYIFLVLLIVLIIYGF